MLVVVANRSPEIWGHAIANIQPIGVEGGGTLIAINLVGLGANGNQGIGIEIPAIGDRFNASSHLLEKDCVASVTVTPVSVRPVAIGRLS